MLEISYQWKLWLLQAARRKDDRFWQREIETMEKRLEAGERVPMVGSRDPLDHLIVQRERRNEMFDSQIRALMTSRLVDRAQWYIVPVPDQKDKEYWDSDTRNNWYLTPSGVAKIRSDIRTEQKARWDFWQSRLALSLAIIGSIFGVLAYFKK